MIVPLEKAGTIHADSVPVSRARLIDECAGYPAIAERDLPDRKLRNLIILANMIAWIMIIALVRYVLF
jgi:hypothetical protein